GDRGADDHRGHPAGYHRARSARPGHVLGLPGGLAADPARRGGRGGGRAHPVEFGGTAHCVRHGGNHAGAGAPVVGWSPMRSASTDEATDMPSGEVEDTRRPAYGPGRVLIFIYGIFALSATARASVQLIRDAAEAPLAYSLSALSAVVYIVATIAIAHNGRRMRRLAWVTVTFELVGVLTVGVLSLTHPELFAHPSVWSGFGVGYGYVPAVLPVLGLVWMWRSSPARIAAA